MVTKNEIYNFLALRIHVYPLYQYAKKCLRVEQANLKSIANFYGFKISSTKGHISLFALNRDYAMKLKREDIEQPLLMMMLGKHGTILIDGVHRAYNQWKAGKKTMPCYVIKDREIIEQNSNADEFPDMW